MYEVLWFTNENPAGEWLEVTAWRGDSLSRAVWEFIRAQRDPRGAYLSLRWG
ncbi:hypothetical protein SEA_VANLEE_119 [Gordonia phage VanLee]|uniref:Uncharacterized protein n=1 Tax=Gordonia phage VanLee TaxID=2845816 RepID=A0A8F2IF93_9CAUD|nr:hypothetical protein QEH49_gp119 [Gordonia phage VanLee]QWS68236.1 hypothetical protein SEA_VANLEE_119 [Gordonia phage VanLee]